jgi:hypothetical protein
VSLELEIALDDLGGLLEIEVSDSSSDPSLLRKGGGCQQSSGSSMAGSAGALELEVVLDDLGGLFEIEVSDSSSDPSFLREGGGCPQSSGSSMAGSAGR